MTPQYNNRFHPQPLSFFNGDLARLERRMIIRQARAVPVVRRRVPIRFGPPSRVPNDLLDAAVGFAVGAIAFALAWLAMWW